LNSIKKIGSTMNKKIIIGVLVSLGLIATTGLVTKSSSVSFSTNNNKSEPKRMENNSNGNISTSENQSPAIGNMIGSAIATGKGSLAINDGKGYLDGKELDMDLSHGINISYSDDGMTINGQKPVFKENNTNIGESRLNNPGTGNMDLDMVLAVQSKK
jgi:hypothetical protein